MLMTIQHNIHLQEKHVLANTKSTRQYYRNVFFFSRLALWWIWALEQLSAPPHTAPLTLQRFVRVPISSPYVIWNGIRHLKLMELKKKWMSDPARRLEISAPVSITADVCDSSRWIFIAKNYKLNKLEQIERFEVVLLMLMSYTTYAFNEPDICTPRFHITFCLWFGSCDRLPLRYAIASIQNLVTLTHMCTAQVQRQKRT